MVDRRNIIDIILLTKDCKWAPLMRISTFTMTPVYILIPRTCTYHLCYFANSRKTRTNTALKCSLSLKFRFLAFSALHQASYPLFAHLDFFPASGTAKSTDSDKFSLKNTQILQSIPKFEVRLGSRYNPDKRQMASGQKHHFRDLIVSAVNRGPPSHQWLYKKLRV